MEFRDLGLQYHHLKSEIDSSIAAVLRSGSFIGGKAVRNLEEELSEYVGVGHCVTCANGTDALQLALMVWGVGSGDAVFVPDFTFFSSGEVVSAVGATPVFVDVDPTTFNLSPVCLSDAIGFVESNTELKPRAVIAVDLFGLPADYQQIGQICDEHDLLLLEDAAQGFGGSIGGRRACSFGDIATTSFFPAKPLGCYGDGGAVFTDNEEWASLLRSYAVHGKGSMKYDNIRIGMNSRLDSMQAAILSVKLAAFVDYELEAVNEIARKYTKASIEQGIEKLDIELPTVPEGYLSSWAQYTLKLPNDIDREGLREELGELGIPTMVYYPKPMHEQRAFGAMGLVLPNACNVTDELCSNALSLPMSPYLTDENLHDVINSLIRIGDNLKNQAHLKD